MDTFRNISFVTADASSKDLSLTCIRWSLLLFSGFSTIWYNATALTLVFSSQILTLQKQIFVMFVRKSVTKFKPDGVIRRRHFLVAFFVSVEHMLFTEVSEII